MAKKVRRKRKEDEPSLAAPESLPSENDLPDFDIDIKSPEESPSVGFRKTVTPSLDGDVQITRSQMGSVKPLSNLSELLNDRSLEAQLNFDEPSNAEPLPSLSDFVRSGSGKEEPLGKKKARAQERRASAMATEPEEGGGGFFSNLPFFGGGNGTDGDADKKVEPLKLLESGTWACIYILVAWEVYLNSPFFERAAPMAPIVYDSVNSI